MNYILFFWCAIGMQPNAILLIYFNSYELFRNDKSLYSTDLLSFEEI
ncbi:MAG: hypothetical protein H6Q69_2300 [Firmicutes bacterium]|nr:hypothetical protein [Bacillota bacterium]